MNKTFFDAFEATRMFNNHYSAGGAGDIDMVVEPTEINGNIMLQVISDDDRAQDIPQFLNISGRRVKVTVQSTRNPTVY
jgi:hypothetical protein